MVVRPIVIKLNTLKLANLNGSAVGLKCADIPKVSLRNACMSAHLHALTRSSIVDGRASQNDIARFFEIDRQRASDAAIVSIVDQNIIHHVTLFMFKPKRTAIERMKHTID